MPTYRFKRPDGTIFEKWMKIGDRDQFIKDNPGTVVLPTAPGDVNVAAFGGKKQPDEGFKDVLRNIRDHAIGGNRLDSRYL